MQGQATSSACDGPGPDHFGGAWWEAEERFNDDFDLQDDYCIESGGTGRWDPPTYTPGPHQCSGSFFSSKRASGKCCGSSGEEFATSQCEAWYGIGATTLMSTRITASSFNGSPDCSNAMAATEADIEAQLEVKGVECGDKAIPGALLPIPLTLTKYYPHRCTLPEWTHSQEVDYYCCGITLAMPSASPTMSSTPTSEPSPSVSATPTPITTPSPAPSP